jgi:transposase
VDTHVGEKVGENVGENVRKECSTDNPTKTAKRRDRRSFSSEFKAEAVRLCKAGDRSIERVTEDLDHTKTALRSTATYVAELARLPRENKQLPMDREIQKLPRSSSRSKAHEVRVASYRARALSHLRALPRA